LQQKIITGIDLAGIPTNPTGWASWKNKEIFACQLYTDKEIVEAALNSQPILVAIDAPLGLPKKGLLRETDREMHKQEYSVFPPLFRTMEKLTVRAIKIVEKIMKEGISILEIHPAPTRKALEIPPKDRKRIHIIFLKMGLKGDLEKLTLTAHEIDATTAALTGYLYLQGKTELIGNEKEGYIAVPVRRNWRKLQL
jgi:predicted nuclease with RNAse H fold